MKKVILMSVKPQYLEKILNGEKTLEIRKSIPNCELPIDVYLYCTYGNLLAYDYIFGLGSFDLYNGIKVSKKRGYGNQVNGYIEAKFTLNKVDEIYYYDEQEPDEIYNDVLECYELDYSKCAVGYMVTKSDLNKMCLTYDELEKYGKGKMLFGWHIDNLEIFDKSMELSEFDQSCDDERGYRKCDKCPFFVEENNPSTGYEAYCNRYNDRMRPLLRAPQSWQYVYVVE